VTGAPDGCVTPLVMSGESQQNRHLQQHEAEREEKEQRHGVSTDIGADFHGAMVLATAPIRYDTRCYFNVRSKADMSRLNLPHGDDN